MAENLSELGKRIAHVAKLVDLVFRLVNSGLIIEEHLIYMLEED